MTEFQQRKGRRVFLIAAAVFFLPVIAAYLLYFVFPEWQPAGKTNYGQLVAPARPLPMLNFRDAKEQPVNTSALYGKWTLLYLGGAECSKSCQDRLYETRQIRTLLNQDRDRLQRAYAAPDAAALAAARGALKEKLHPDLVYFDLANSGLRDFFQPQEADAIYLLDPHANWLMVYPAAQGDYKGILKDLKKLLRLSQIG